MVRKPTHFPHYLLHCCPFIDRKFLAHLLPVLKLNESSLLPSRLQNLQLSPGALRYLQVYLCGLGACSGLRLLRFEVDRVCLRLGLQDVKSVAPLGSPVVIQMGVLHFKLIVEQFGIRFLELLLVEVLEYFILFLVRSQVLLV